MQGVNMPRPKVQVQGVAGYDMIWIVEYHIYIIHSSHSTLQLAHKQSEPVDKEPCWRAARVLAISVDANHFKCKLYISGRQDSSD